MQVQSYYSQALQDGRRDGGGGLSAQTVLHHHRVLKSTLQQAVKWQVLVLNPAVGVEPPRPKHREMRVFSEAELGQLLNASKGTWAYQPILLAATSGLRRGEVLGLHWSDLDLKAGALAVRQTLQQSPHGPFFKEPKSQKSKRVVTLPQVTVDALRRHRAEQAKQRLMMGTGYLDQDLVFAQPDGGPLYPDSLTQYFDRLVDRLGIPGGRLHDLRHTHITMLLKQGVPIKVLADRAGHADVALTLRVYAHALPDMQQDAARKMDDLLNTAILQSRGA